MPITTLAFDADDTLWHNESIFALSQQRFAELLSDYADAETLGARLLETERGNLGVFGYGVKGFTLSLIETAIAVTEGRVPADIIRALIDLAKMMLTHPVEPLPDVAETLDALKGRYRLIVITKGDLFDQEAKIARSGLGDLFDAVEIVSEKDEAVYRRILARHGDGPDKAVMIGNSLRSDILPMLAAGGHAVHIPYHLTWAHEAAEPPTGHPRFAQLARMAELPGWLRAVHGGVAAT
jgi:putative hydrolase of the HAD superfamily